MPNPKRHREVITFEIYPENSENYHFLRDHFRSLGISTTKLLNMLIEQSAYEVKNFGGAKDPSETTVQEVIENLQKLFSKTEQGGKKQV